MTEDNWKFVEVIEQEGEVELSELWVNAKDRQIAIVDEGRTPADASSFVRGGETAEEVMYLYGYDWKDFKEEN